MNAELGRVWGAVAIRRDLRRMARLRADGLSFGAAVALGLGLGHVRPRPRDHLQYPGAGPAGDRDAVTSDFESAMTDIRPSTSNRVR